MNIVVDKILDILKTKNMTKKEFAQKLIDLEPKIGLKGEAPSERTIYLYLQGKRELKADLIPYIADVLDIQEQELFTNEYSSLVAEQKASYNKHTILEQELIELLPYIPEAMLRKFIEKAKSLKDIIDK